MGGASWLDRLKGWLSLGPPVIELGSEGQAVVNLQHLLGVQPADGSFGPITQTAVRAFQSAHGIDPDGVVGPITWSAFDGRISTRYAPRSTGGGSMQPLPDGAKPIPQAVANKPAITAFAIELVHTPSLYPRGSVTERTIDGQRIVGRIEDHTWTHRDGKLVTGLNPPIRGASMYWIPESSMSGDFAGARSYMGGEYAIKFPGYSSEVSGDRYNQMTRFDGDGGGVLPGTPYAHSVSSVGHERYHSPQALQKKGLPRP